MIVSLQQGIVVSLLLATSLLTTTTAVDILRRINVAPGKSIAAAIQNAHDAGIQPRFNLFAELAGSMTEYEVHVREAVPAVTSETTISFQGGNSHNVNEDNVATMLVGDEHADKHLCGSLSLHPPTVGGQHRRRLRPTSLVMRFQ